MQVHCPTRQWHVPSNHALVQHIGSLPSQAVAHLKRNMLGYYTNTTMLCWGHPSTTMLYLRYSDTVQNLLNWLTKFIAQMVQCPDKYTCKRGL